MFRIIPAIAVAALALAPATAPAAATLVSPAQGSAINTSKPVFQWAPGAGETSENLIVSSQSTVDSTGELSGSLAIYQSTAATSHQHDRALYSGTYFWQVETSALDADGDKVYPYLHSPVGTFTIRPQVTMVKQSIETYKSINIFHVTPKWAGNMKNMKVSVSVFRGKKLLFSKSQARESYGVGVENRMLVDFKNKKVREGTRLRSVVKVQGSGVTKTSTKVFRAP